MSTITRAIALLVYQDIPAAYDLLIEAFGISPGGIHRDPSGNAVHAEVHAGNLTIWLHRVAAESKLASPRTLPASASGLVIHVDDVDAHFHHARAHGAVIQSEPKDQPYGQRECGATDPEGHRWWFATPLK